MSFITIVFVYVVVWWMVFMAALPIGIKIDEKKAKKGHVKSAPTNPNLRKKFIYTSIISAFLTAIYWLALKMQWISLN